MSGEKTEAPTRRRLEDRRREGQVPQRKHVIEAALLSFVALLLIGLFGPLSGMLLNISTAAFSVVSQDFDAARAKSFVAIAQATYWILAICGSSAVFVLVFGMLLNKFVFAPKALSPKFERFNPVTQLKGIFSKATLYNFVRMTFLFGGMVGIFSALYLYNVDNALHASYCGSACLYHLFWSRIGILVAAIFLLLLVLAVVDYFVQSRMFLSQNKMSKEEIKREYKEQEGDPEIKAGRKSIALNDAVLPLLSDATHVVHSDQVLVAIIFYPASGQPPYLIFKSKGAGVPELRRKIQAMRIPIFHMPGAALELYRMGSPGQYLPARSLRAMEKMLGGAAA